MNPEIIKEFIEKIPFTLFLVFYFIFLGYEHYVFENDSGSDLNLKRQEVVTEKKTKETLENNLKGVQQFIKILEKKKEEVRGLALSLQKNKDAIPENLDVPNVMKLIYTEGKKVGLKLDGIDPLKETQSEYYYEHPFRVKASGVYIQMVAFLDRLTRVSQVLHVDEFELKPSGRQDSKYVQLKGEYKISVYRYLGGKADQLGKALIGVESSAKVVDNKSSSSYSPSAAPPSHGGAK